MKKKFWIIMCMCILLTACASPNAKADKKWIGELDSSIDNQSYTSTVEINFNSDDETITKMVYKSKYNGLEKSQTNNLILADLINRQSIIEQIEGVNVSLNVTDTSFDYEEKWEYNDIDVKVALEADDLQKKFIENEKYSINKIKTYYEQLGYSFKEKNIK